MTWDVQLWCHQCNRLIGTVHQVDSQHDLELKVRRRMREHEVEHHGGKA